MSTSRVLRLQEFRDRLERRVERATVLYGADADRSELVRHLFAAISAAGGDRGALVWVDEYGPGTAHTHLVLDLASELPRREFPVEPLRLAWSAGVPGLYDIPARDTNFRFPIPWGCKSLCSVALGSDGLRAWFLVVDGQNARGPLDADATGRIMFAAGECAGVVMHRDLLREGRTLLAPEGGPDRFSGWPILKDIEGHEEDELTHRRISCRFLVARTVRSLVDDDLGADRDGLAEQVSEVRREIESQLPGDAERALWDRVLDALANMEMGEITGALLALGERVEDQGHFSGARELYRSAYEIAMGLGDERLALESARLAGRACRRQAAWDVALGWYGVARALSVVAGARGMEAAVLDGVANVHRERGNLPKAREILIDALALAQDAQDARALGNVYQNLMAVSGLAGDHEGAIRYGWKAVQLPQQDEDRLKALTGLAGMFLLAGDHQAAEDAYVIVAKRVRRLEYRLYALSGYAQTAGLRGNGPEFKKRLCRLEEAGFDNGSPKFRAEAQLEIGQVFLALGDEVEAERRYRLALALAEQHRLNQFVFRSERALESLSAGRARQDEFPAAPPPSAEVLEIREELAVMRETVGSFS